MISIFINNKNFSRAFWKEKVKSWCPYSASACLKKRHSTLHYTDIVALIHNVPVRSALQKTENIYLRTMDYSWLVKFSRISHYSYYGVLRGPSTEVFHGRIWRSTVWRKCPQYIFLASLHYYKSYKWYRIFPPKKVGAPLRFRAVSVYFRLVTQSELC